MTTKQPPKDTDIAMFRAGLAALGMSQRDLARELEYAEGTVSKWVNGKIPIPRWVDHAMNGIAFSRMVAAARTKGYPWPPVGYPD